MLFQQKISNYVPDPKYYHDISFILTFYEAACKAKEARMEKMNQTIEKIMIMNVVIRIILEIHYTRTNK